MSYVLGVDPGSEQSAYALVNIPNRHPTGFGKVANGDLATLIEQLPYAHGMEVDAVGLEMVKSYGKPVGVEVFDTVLWTGRYWQICEDGGLTSRLVGRDEVKLHHCRSRTAKDPYIVQALVDRFTPGARNYGKGTKAEPGWFHGFTADVWQAYALAVLLADQIDPDGVPIA